MYILNPNIILEEMEHKYVLLNKTNLLLFHLNETASLIIKLIIKKESEATIIQAITEKFEVKKTQAQKDYKKLVKDLCQKNILLRND